MARTMEQAISNAAARGGKAPCSELSKGQQAVLQTAMKEHGICSDNFFLSMIHFVQTLIFEIIITFSLLVKFHSVIKQFFS